MSQWSRRLGATSAGAALLAPGAALACHEDPTPPPDRYDNVVSVGIILSGISFAPKVRFVYGLDVRVGRGPVAGVVRVEGRGVSSVRAVAGAQLMFGHSSTEVGLALHSGISGGEIAPSLGVHLGQGYASRGSGLLAQGTIPVLWDLRNYDVSLAGVLVPNDDTFKFCLPSGRPLRLGAAVLLPDVGTRTDAEPESPERAALAEEWIGAARAEYASIWAFHRLAADLTAAGAPEALVREALDAAKDEEHHALLCAGLAETAFWMHPLAPEACRPRWNWPSDEATAALAREAWVDGCLGEGIAAAQAERAGDECEDQTVGAVQATIGRDERRHAELGWRILTWAWRSGGATARDQIVKIVASRPQQQRAAIRGDADPDWLMARGLLRTDLMKAVAEDETSYACDRARKLVGAA